MVENRNTFWLKRLDFENKYIINAVMIVAPHRNGGAFSLYE